MCCAWAAVARLDDAALERDRVQELRLGVERTPEERREIDEFVDEYDRGEWRLVRLDLFADLAADDGSLQRFDSERVRGVWFKVPHGPDNERHAQEAADQNLDRLHDHLRQEGFEVPAEQLESAQFRLELDERLREALSTDRG